MATKNAIITAVMAEIGDRTSDTAVKALYRVWFDEALETLLAKFPWNYRRGLGTIAITATGFSSFELPASIVEIRRLRNQATGRVIEKVERPRLFDAEVDLTETGDPRFWFEAGFSSASNLPLIGLHPLPAADLTLQYDAHLSVPLPLSDTDEVPVTREAIGVIREFIRAYSYENEGLTELANAAWQRGFLRLEGLVDQHGNKQAARLSQLREDGDLANARRRYPAARFGPIPTS